MASAPLILASSSPRRLALLAQIGVAPDETIPADIDESVRPGETPRVYVARLAREKAEAVSQMHRDGFVLAADTAVACGRRILPKAEDEAAARDCLSLISGRGHRVYSGVALKTPKGTMIERLVETRVRVRRMNAAGLDEYIRSGEWRGKAGGYAIQGLFAKHIIGIIGSYTNVVGLPLYETANMLVGAGLK